MGVLNVFETVQMVFASHIICGFSFVSYNAEHLCNFGIVFLSATWLPLGELWIIVKRTASLTRINTAYLILVSSGRPPGDSWRGWVLNPAERLKGFELWEPY